jgi:phosphatidylserine/phosphatidylglycerophosphate/cardiolipin synthase-like enzyme
MILSKFLLCTAGCVGFVIAAELYHQASLVMKARREEDEINEILFTRDPLDYNTRMTRNIQFTDDKPWHVKQMMEGLLLSAQKSIHVAMYIFTNPSLGKALLKQHERGVQIYVIADDSQSNAKSSQIQVLKNAGIPVRIYRGTLNHGQYEYKTFHHKMCLIDVPFNGNESPITSRFPSQPISIPANGLFISGSLNWTNEGLTGNEENITFTSNKNVCQKALKKFNDLWENCEV